MLDTKKSVIRFADVEICEREFLSSRRGKFFQVEPKAFRVLLFLLHNPQKLITKEELLNAVWGETAVSENSLTRSIALLRKLLGDDTHQPRFIETVATVGYRFVCPVEVVEDANGGLEPGVPARGRLRRAGGERRGSCERDDTGKGHGRMGWIVRRKWLAGAVVVGVVCSRCGDLVPVPPSPQCSRITEYAQIIHDTHQKTPVGTDGARLYFNDVLRPESSGSELQCQAESSRAFRSDSESHDVGCFDRMVPVFW